MSNSRLKNTSTKSFIQQPIEYRSIFHDRNRHHPLDDSNYRQSRSLMVQQPSQTHSKLEQYLNHPRLSAKANNGQSPQMNKSNHILTTSKKQMLSTSTDKKGISQKINSTRNETIPLSQKKSFQRQPQQSLREKQKLQVKEIKLQPLQKGSKLQLTLKKSEDVRDKIQDLNNKLQDIVNRKLRLVLNETRSKKDLSASVIRLMKENINEELKQIIMEIRALKNSNQISDVSLLNKKISFIETILAEQATESQLMRKYYYKVTSNKKKGKIGDFNHIKTRLGEVYKSYHLQQKQKKYTSIDSKKIKQTRPLFEGTTSKQAYKKPKPQDYQSYRYKQRQIPINLQPLPRSSYKRQFFYMRTQPDQKIINRDHSPYNPNNKSYQTSIYEKDYRLMKTQMVDHKELDAYKNKIKVLKVNYMPKNRFQTVDLDRDTYYKDVQTSSRQARSPSPQRHHASQNQIIFNKHMLKSEAHRSYQAEQLFEKSRIKHQQLKQFQYRLKNIFKA